MLKYIRNQFTWVGFVLRLILIVSLALPQGLNTLIQNSKQPLQENSPLVSNQAQRKIFVILQFFPVLPQEKSLLLSLKPQRQISSRNFPKITQAP